MRRAMVLRISLKSPLTTVSSSEYWKLFFINIKTLSNKTCTYLWWLGDQKFDLPGIQCRYVLTLVSQPLPRVLYIQPAHSCIEEGLSGCVHTQSHPPLSSCSQQKHTPSILHHCSATPALHLREVYLLPSPSILLISDNPAVMWQLTWSTLCSHDLTIIGIWGNILLEVQSV